MSTAFLLSVDYLYAWTNTVKSGNVGLSLGHPAVITSLCGQFTPFSKLVICAMMIRGRHRALPYAIDRAIMLPTDDSNDDTNEGRLEGKRDC